MKTLLTLAFILASILALRAELPPKMPAKVSTTEDFRQLLLSTRWMWKNVSANVPDRECVFMPDGTFRHPHFVAKFVIKDIKTVDLVNKNGIATLTFDPTYTKFDALDFGGKRGITGYRK
jgi:hypothetical protein